MGKSKTDRYYQRWESLSNGQLNEGKYIELFSQSDAMIHDSGSFLLEYLFTDKPVMFLIKNDQVYDQFAELGINALNNIEQGFSKEDIIIFVENVINNVDKMKVLREKFVEKNIMPPNNKLASENIYSHLLDCLT